MKKLLMALIATTTLLTVVTVAPTRSEAQNTRPYGYDYYGHWPDDYFYSGGSYFYRSSCHWQRDGRTGYFVCYYRERK